MNSKDALKLQVEEEKKQIAALYGNGAPTVVDGEGHVVTPPNEPEATTPETKEPSKELPKTLDTMFGKDAKPNADKGEETELDRLRRENAELKMREGSAKGRLEKASADNHERLEALEAERNELRAQVEKLQASNPQVDDILTDEERDLLDPSALGVLQKLAKGESKRAVAKAEAELEALRARLHNSDVMSAQSARKAFTDQVESLVPEAGEFVSAENEAWVGFLKTRVPFGRDTFENVASRAFAENDVDSFVQVLQAYQATAGVGLEVNPSVLTQMRPDSARIPHQQSGAQTPKVYTVKDVTEHWEQWNSGHVDKTDPKMIALHEDMTRAVNSGQVA